MPFLVFALSIPELQLSESLSEKKRGNEFLQLIWNTDSVIADVEMTTYLRELGYELGMHSENPDKHFTVLMPLLALMVISAYIRVCCLVQIRSQN